MVHEAAASRVMGMVEDAVERGARFALEPRRDGATVSPGILVDVPRTARLWNEEVFGPVLVVKTRSEEHTSELESLMRISYAVFCLKKQHTRPGSRENSHHETS